MTTKEDLLNALTVKQLKQMAKDNNIPLKSEGLFWDNVATTKEEIIKKLASSNKITKERISASQNGLPLSETFPMEAKPENKKVIVNGKVNEERIVSKAIQDNKKEANTQFDKLIEEINEFKKVAPPIRTTKKAEKLCATALVSYLRRSFPEIQEQFSMGVGSLIDAIVGKIGLEVKFRPDQNEINRLYGQTDDYLQHIEGMIVVFFNTDSGTVNNYKLKLERSNYHSKVSVITI